jgi:hypothetical protein
MGVSPHLGDMVFRSWQGLNNVDKREHTIGVGDGGTWWNIHKLERAAR